MLSRYLLDIWLIRDTGIVCSIHFTSEAGTIFVALPIEVQFRDVMADFVEGQ